MKLWCYEYQSGTTQLTSDIKSDGVADPVPLWVVSDAGVDPGLGLGDPLEHQGHVGDDDALGQVVR